MAQLFDTARIGNEPELRYTQGQNPQAVLELALPCEYGRKDPQTNKKPTQWVQATVWGKRAEALAPYLIKNQWISFTLDDVHIEEFTRRDGTPGNKLVGTVSALKLVGSAPQQGAQPSPAQAARQPAPRPQAAAPQQQPAPDYDSFDDDIPFDNPYRGIRSLLI
ncbi:single-stranded DNA-binding protein [Pseudomonas sp.]|uniref:single-stranded DNA-binding protein n=1 Tax=Pseudomonas sp. TaxID=306 RepID=UPI001A02D5E4|nr:single-stranded DNA-binding protein [Pseudomonas sp.]MBF0675550.1 single-stranded DNA-binding protein [Pseudomonas sp.]